MFDHYHLHINPDKIIKLLKQIIMNQQEAAEKLNTVATQVAKVQTEVQKLIDTANGDDTVSPELQAAIDSVAAAVQGVDDLNADEETPPAPEA